MKSFKQFNEDGAYTDRFAQQGTEDETHALFNVQEPWEHWAPSFVLSPFLLNASLALCLDAYHAVNLPV